MIVDDDLARYNPDIISMDRFKDRDSEHETIIICASDPTQNLEIVKELKKRKIQAQVKNILSLPVVHHPEKEDYFNRVKELLRVRKASGYELARFGRHNDGGYVLLNDIQNCRIAYSFGINDDVSWDEEIAAYGVEVYCYDHTIHTLPKENTKLHFNKIGIGATDSLGTGLLSIDTILSLNKHQKETGMIMKMDVEGAEWEFIHQVGSEILNRFSQLTFEFHHVANPDFLNCEDTLAVFEKLNQTHQVIWIHANNYDIAERAGEVILPNTLEITYANKNQYQFEPTEYDCPLSIDEPNYYLRPDIELKGFGAV
ncbi:MAG: hypothetical protein HFE97_13105 [Oscillospiraceae bacterium]|nr:hypothetical protein [Oscillospiraceae bacterium]